MSLAPPVFSSAMNGCSSLCMVSPSAADETLWVHPQRSVEQESPVGTYAPLDQTAVHMQRYNDAGSTIGAPITLKLLGTQHDKLTYRFQGRDYRLTDVFGKVVDKLIA